MTVYVDELRVWPHARHACFRKGSAHLTADTIVELHAFAARLALKVVWFQSYPVHPHYDLSPAKQALALKLGAVFVPAREQARKRLAAHAVLQQAASVETSPEADQDSGNPSD